MKTEENKQISYSELESKILEQYPSLSKRLRQIAHFVLDNPNDIAIKTAASISNEAQVQPSALIRFAQTFGFAGFSELQQVYKSKLLENNTANTQHTRPVNTKSTYNTKEAILHDVIHSNMQALGNLQETITEADLHQAASILDKAESIYIIGLRKSLSAASYITYNLAQNGKSVHLLDGVGGLLELQTVAMTKKDALIAISFTPYAQETLNVIDICHNKQIPIVAISDNKLSPVTHQANVNLLAQESEVKGIRSITTSLALSQTLLLAMAQTKK